MSENKSGPGADIALIAAAQKVEHYEIASYTAACTLAQQLKMPDVVQLLQMSLSEEQNASLLLDQVARPMMTKAKQPETIS